MVVRVVKMEWQAYAQCVRWGFKNTRIVAVKGSRGLEKEEDSKKEGKKRGKGTPPQWKGMKCVQALPHN